MSTAALKARARFFLSLLPRMLAGRCTTTRLVGHGIALNENGNRRLGTWCVNRAMRSCAQDKRTADAVIDFCVRAGYYKAAEQFASAYYDANGLHPGAAVRLIASLVLSNGHESALRVLDRLVRHCGDDVGIVSPAPARPRPLRGHELRAMLEARLTDGVLDPVRTADLDLSVARLCFSFAAFDASARLFERVGEHAAMDVEDRIAHAYALLRSDAVDRIPRGLEKLCAATSASTPGADWQILLATVLFARGAEDAAAAVIETVLDTKLAGHSDAARIAADCRAMLAHLSSCPSVLAFDAGVASVVPAATTSRLRKLFVCGSGWSGSGALYDALAEYDGLAEAPNTPLDRYMNVGTDSEMTFVQGPAGLGGIWRTAREERKLSRLDLWDLFRFHVLGGGAIGYSQHKSAKVASNLLELYGGDYTVIFRRLYESFAASPDGASLAQLRATLTEATEALSAVFARSTASAPASFGDGDCVVFNNAIFGPNIDMLEIFRNVRAAVVVRDPLDQYADRRAKDFKHWMAPSPFAPLYRGSREAFHARREALQAELAREVREIEFERFVLDAPYRQSAIDWLLEGQNVRRVRRRFEPERSAKNVGIHATLLTPDERQALEKDLKQWRRS